MTIDILHLLVNNARIGAITSGHKGQSTMYEYRILFPRLGTREIRRDLGAGPPTSADRRRPGGDYRPERPARRERS